MPHFALGHRLPHAFAAPLFGDRQGFGLTVRPEDPSWEEWQRTLLTFYDATQQRSVGAYVNDAGYRVMAKLDLAGKSVLEIGPGEIHHLQYWHGTPSCYTIADIQTPMLERSARQLEARQVSYKTCLLSRADQGALPFEDGSFDLIVSFYALEHLYPLPTYLEEMVRVLAPGGVLAGAIPCEGGLGWGMGRYLTTRRWLKSHTTIDPDKIICWEHPNFADHILETLDAMLVRRRLDYWPLGVPSIDLNLVAAFVYDKR